MPLEVDREKCDGCGLCVEICPIDTLRLDEEGRPYDKYNECWYCGCCEAECPRKAIRILLPYPVS